MKSVVALVAVVLIFIVLTDAFETIVLPRRVARRFRLTRFYYRITWISWSGVVGRISSAKQRETYFGFFGPLSLIILLCVWAGVLIVGFGLLHWAIRTPLQTSQESIGFGAYVYFSGTTFFTLGYGDVTPVAALGRALAVIEAGIGFGFLALVIGYVPVIYQAFSRRESTISLLDARAGSPPTAAELLRRHAHYMTELDQLLRDWERWSAELMESHISYPLLCYYRSQHNNQSWLAALTAVLDACALVATGVDGASRRQAQLTFAMARHAVVDLAQIFNTPPRAPVPDRLPPEELLRLRASLAPAGVLLKGGRGADLELAELRQRYEPYVNALADYLYVQLPPWVPSTTAFDNWQTSAWERISAGVVSAPSSPIEDGQHL
ncbi:MAG TPA: potassium channel family protein [Blastocatellia bacterium]|nr:potassium channel family protein [Blastocatellia bacterium]